MNLDMINHFEFEAVAPNQTGYVYLAGPYTSPDLIVRQTRYGWLTAAAVWLAARGYVVFSPITQWHSAAEIYQLPTNYAFWSTQNHGMLQAASELVVLKLPGWNKSVGVKGEIKFAKGLGLQVLYLKII